MYLCASNAVFCSLPSEYPQDIRSEKLETLSRLKKELEALESELNAYGDSNPAKVEEAKRAVFLAKEASYRWTGMQRPFVSLCFSKLTTSVDNYSVLLGHFVKQNGVSVEDIRQYLEIGEDYEDL